MKKTSSLLKMQFEDLYQTQKPFHICKKDLECGIVYHPGYTTQIEYIPIMHWHDYIELEIVISGEGKNICNGVEHSLCAGDAFMSSYHDCHMLISTNKLYVLNISLYYNILDEKLANYITSVNNFNCKFTQDELNCIMYLVDNIVSKYEEDTETTQLSAKILLNTIFILFIENCNFTPAHTSNQIQLIIEYINKNPSEDLRLDRVAKLFSTSANYLGKIFKQSMNVSYSEYINKMRLRYACQLITSTSMSIKEIGSYVGYSSLEYFYYVFKKYMHISPIQYKKNLLSK